MNFSETATISPCAAIFSPSPNVTCPCARPPPLAAGLVNEIGEAALPAPLRRTRLYRNLVEVTLRFFY